MLPGQTGDLQHPAQHLPEGNTGDFFPGQQGQLRQNFLPGGDGQGSQPVTLSHRSLHRFCQFYRLRQSAGLGFFQKQPAAVAQHWLDGGLGAELNRHRRRGASGTTVFSV